ncbi:MAG: zinc ABC transporter substrate-binding protein [Clostridia bacterium]|nr:zinc ABC transporter substrate-binding protein [Clostridia bacterium]
MKKLFCLIMALLIIFIMAGCSETQTTNNSKLSIVAVSFPEYDFARAVAGDLADIKMLIPPAGEVHGYEPTVSDIRAVSTCDLLIYTGGESDTWTEKLIDSANNKNLRALAMVDFAEHICFEDHNHEENHDKFTFDEHIWTSPENAISIVNAIKNTLSEIDAENKKAYEDNSKAYCEKLDKLDKDIKVITENTNKNTLVFGDRFPLAYFANNYKLEYLSAFSGCSEDTEASASTIAMLIDYVKENNIPVVFINELSNTSIAEQIAKETGAEVRTFYSCHKVSKDDFESGKTYIDIMSRNIENLNIALH